MYRLHVGPALWAAITVYSVTVNLVVLGCVQVHMHVWVVVLVGYVLVAVGWVVAWGSILPEKQKGFFKHDTLKLYLEREWDVRTASRPGWGENLVGEGDG